MKSSIPISFAIVASATLALYLSSGLLRTWHPMQKPDLLSLHDRHEKVGEDFEAALERLKLELGQEEQVISSNGREKRRYSADSVETNHDDGTFRLKGRAWHLDHHCLTDGRADPLSAMTVDASTLKILERSGHFETTELVEPKQ